MPSQVALASAAPAVPDSPVVGAVTANSIAVTWSAPASDGGSAITTYELYASGTRVAKIPSRTYTIGGLTGGLTYNVTLKACNLFGCSAESDPVSVVTMPSAATGLKATTGAGSIALSWVDSTSANVTSHSIFYRPTSVSTWTEWTPGVEDESGTTITGLTNGTTYAARVRVVAPQGATDTVTVLATPMDIPSVPVLSYSNVSQSSLVLAWTMPTTAGAVPTSFEVFRAGVKIATTTARFFSVSGLTSLQEYSFTVKACNATGCSAASLPATVTLPPSPPSRQTAVAVGSKIVVSWLNSPVADYHSVWYKLSTEPTTWTEWTPGEADTSPTELLDLPGGVTYNIRIGAHGTNGIAAYSPIVNVVPFSEPAAPYSLRQLAAGASTATVTWIAPSNGGAAITGYKVFVDGGLYSEPASNATSVAFSNLEIGARYVVTIQACNTVGCSASSTALPIFTVPVGPSAVATSAVGPTTATVTWTASTSTFVSGYKIFFRRTGTTTWVEFTPQSDDVSGTVVSSLLVNTPYELYVRAYNPKGFADTSIVSFTTQNFQVPTEPTALSAVAVSGGARLSWTAPSWNGAATISDYRIEWSSDTGTTWTAVQRAASTLTTATVTGLTPGINYRFRVSAKNIAGFSPPSIATSTVAPFSTPSAPTATSATAGDKEATVTWVAPADNGSSAITDYIIQYSSNGTYWSVFSDGVSNTTSAVVGGLTNGTTYVFRVAAVNAAGQGAWSLASSSVTPIAPPTPPTKLTVFPAASSVRLAWAVPASNGGSVITDYTVQVSADDGATWTTFQDGVSALTSATVTGLTNGAVYMFRVAAVNSLSSSDWSVASPPTSPRALADPPTSLIGIAVDGKISLSWTAPLNAGGSPITDYQVQMSSNNGSTWRLASDLLNPTTSALITGLTNGTPYVFKVAAVTAAGPGTYSSVSAAFTPRTSPGAPQYLLATVGDRQSMVSWKAPLSNGGASITDYILQYSSDDGASWLTFPDGVSSSLSTVVTGLDNGQTYSFRVKAENVAGPGPFSAPTALLLKSASQPPQNLTATAGDRSIALDWDVPVDDGGSVISSYAIFYSSNNGLTWLSFSPTTDTDATISGLANGTAYLVKVAAVTGFGVGLFSSLPTAVTPSTVPTAPTSVVGVYGDKSATLTWAAPSSNGGASITNYLIQYSTDGGATWEPATRPGASTQRTYTVTGLTNGLEYVFQVAAVNASGNSAWSSSTPPVTPHAPASQPLSVSGTYGNASVALSWATPTDDGGAAITDYTIQTSTNGTSWTAFSDGTSASTSASVTGLTNGTGYYFRVAAVTVFGSGVWSSVYGPITPRTVPGAPTAVTGAFGDKQITTSWAAPASNGGSVITDYVVEFSADNGSNWITVTRTASTTTSQLVSGLANGVSYIFRVAAVNAVGTSGWSVSSSGVTPRTLPTAPTSLAGVYGNASAALSWSAPADDGGASISSYAIQFSSNAGTTWTSFTNTASANTAVTVTGLTNGTTYVFRVAAINSVGTGAWSATSTSVVPRTAPGAPTAVAGTYGNTQVGLTWAAPASNGGSGITDYVIEYSSDSGTTWTAFSDSESTAVTTTVTGLTNGTLYSFRVAAVNDAGRGVWSSASSGVTPRTTPGAATAVTGTYGNALVALSWAAPADNGGAAVTNYLIQYSSNAGASWSSFSRAASSATAGTVTGLTNGVEYVFRVAAVNSVGTGAWSSESAGSTPRTTPGVPRFLLPAEDDRQVTLTWDAPLSDGGSTITDYAVQYSTNNGTSWTTFSDGVSASTGAVVTGLTNGTAHRFRVAAINAEGTGSYTSASSSVTPRSLPGDVTDLAATPGNAQVALSWTAPADDGGSAITDYVVQFSSNGGTTWTTFSDGVSITPSATVTGLTNGTLYYIRVATKNSAGPGGYVSITATPRTIPGVPTALTAAAGYHSADLDWTAPASNGGNAITDYAIQYSTDAGATWTTHPHTASTTPSISVRGLTPGVASLFRVAAMNAAGQGSWSSSVSTTPTSTLGAPESVVGTYGDASVALSWSAPYVPAETSLIDYVIQYSSDSGANWSSFAKSTSTDTNATVTGLTNGTSYVFRVAAVNPNGTGSWSSASASVLPHATPDAPTGVTPTYGNTSVALTWTAPASNGGLAITNYVIQYSSNSGSSWTTFSDGTSTNTSTTVTGLANGTPYVFRVAAVNDAQGSWSSTSPAATPRTTPAAPTSVSGTFGNASVVLTWTAPASSGGASITDYAIHYSINGTTWTPFADGTSAATSATVTGLTNGTLYVFRVSALNSEGSGPWSSTSSSVRPHTVPDAPTAVTPTYGNTQVSLSWTTPASNGGLAITDYVVQYSSDAGSNWTTASDGVSTSTSATVIGLTNGTPYVFRVAAVNDEQGAWSATSAPATPRTTASAPTALAGTFGNASVALTWTAPSDNGGASITDYSIQYSSNSGSTWTSFPHTASAASGITVTGLTNGTTYVFRVGAVNSEGTGAWSSTSASVLPHTTPGAPTAVTPTHGNAQVALSWAAPASNGGLAITDYVIQYSSNSGSTWTTFADGTSTSTSTTITGLTNGTGYVFRVAAVNDAQGSWSATSASATPRTVTNTPSGLTATAGNAQVSLTWTAPSDNGGASITDYSIQYSSDSGTTWTSFSRTASTTASATITGLTNGTPYSFRVAAINSEGASSYTPNATATPMTTPGAPSITGATVSNNNAVSISFSAPASNGGSSITGYTATCAGSNGSTPTASGAGSPLSVSISNTGINYTCSVTATNGVGTSGASNTRTLSSTYVNPVYYCNAGDSPSSSSSSTFQCTNAAWNNHPYWVSTYYYSSCSIGGWNNTTPFAGSPSGASAWFGLYTTASYYTSPYNGTTARASNWQVWAAYGGGACNGQVTHARWGSTSCNSTSTGSGSNGTCSTTFKYRRYVDTTRSVGPYCPSGGVFSGDYCYPHWPNSGYWADNWYYDYTYYNAPLRASGYWNGWTVS